MKLSIGYAALAGSLAMVLGLLLPRHVSWLGTFAVLLLFAGIMIVAFVRFKSKAAPFFIICLLLFVSFLRGYYWLENALEHRLPLTFDRSRAQLELFIERTETTARGCRMLATVHSASLINTNNGPLALRRVRLSWYDRTPETTCPAMGNRISAEVVLRAARGLANGLWFDYESLLLLKGIDATGYLRSWQLIDQSEHWSVSRWRQQFIQRQLQHQIPPARNWVAGLVFGEGDGFSTHQWWLARQTGTLHLLVVSGLHLALLGVLALGLLALLRRGYGVVFRRSLPALMPLTVITLLLLSGFYAFISGSGVAVQRAWLMLALVWLIHFALRRFAWPVVLAVAMYLVLWWSPLRVTQMGFQLSFAAVMVLLLFFSGRRTSRVALFWWPQWVIFLCLTPLLMEWNAPLTVNQLLANVFAVPFVSLLILPLTLLYSVLPLDGLAQLLIWLGQEYWTLLQWFAAHPVASLTVPTGLSWVAAVMALLLWLRGVNFPLNGLLPITVLLVMVVGVNVGVDEPKAKLSLLDVGQGVSLVAVDDGQALVVDAGARFSSRFDLGEAVVTPVLRGLNSPALTVVVSHSDNDHAGGVASLVKNFDVTTMYAGQVEPLLADLDANHVDLPVNIHSCHHNTRWQTLTAKVRYRFFTYTRLAQDNNQSCVLLLEWYGQRILLPGDIETEVEQQLVQLYGAALKADILVAPHHGSRSSSSRIFIQAVAPAQVWFSAGFNNRFHHPHPQVVARYQSLGIDVLNTASRGALSLDSSGRLHQVRQGWQRPWLYP